MILIPVVLVNIICLYRILRSVAVRVQREYCELNIRQIGQAIHSYAECKGKLPPAWNTDANGVPLHSWRVLILPYLGYNDLYGQIRLNEPWDSHWNRQFHHKVPLCYRCPVCHHQRLVSSEALTQDDEKKNYLPDRNSEKSTDIKDTSLNPPLNCDYSVIVDPNSMFPGELLCSFQDVSDGLSNTVMLVERRTPVCWMDPTQELSLTEALDSVTFQKSHDVSDTVPSRNPSFPSHRTGTNVLFGDGRVQFIHSGIAVNVAKELFLRNDGNIRVE